MHDVLSYLQKYYPIKILGDITWSHATNSQEKLQIALNDPQLMMIEVDVRVNPEGNPVLAHPPAVDSDLSFAEFIQIMANHHQGIKLDFKDAEILIPCLTILRESNLQQPVLLNAGILQGYRSYPPKFSAVGFMALCKKIYPRGILSPDWTLYQDPYTKENIDEMLELCHSHGIRQITFPIRTSDLPISWEHLSRLIEDDGYTITAWDGKPVSKDLLQWLQENIDPTKVCFDCFDENHNRLKWW
jgi:Uncharacterized conserved protein (DUF2181)